MDAREQLRRYLEQRREMGERELILDGMSVEEVMRILGAEGTAAKDTGSAPRQNVEPREPSATRTARTDDPPADSSDWRAILRAAGNEPSRATNVSGPAAPATPPPPTPPVPDDIDDADAPEDAVAGPPAYVMRPTPQAMPRVRSTPPPAGDPPPGIIVGTASRELFGGPLSGVTTLDELAEIIAKCTKCPLYRTATKPVPGQGSPAAELVCVGEAPGENEDKSGLAFVGQAGQLLTKILAAINLRREDVFICNVLKHRPPGNRNPMPQEVEACSPYLVRQLEIIRPKVVVAFGTFAAQTLLETKLSISKLRGSVHKYYGIPLIVTYHPAALLRNPAWKRPTWEDVQLARRVLDRAAGA
jgi:uracil-DNA glycosylase family 4